MILCSAISHKRRILSFLLGALHAEDYPECMKETCGDRQVPKTWPDIVMSFAESADPVRLPTFTPDESALLKGSSDFFGLNLHCTCAMESCLRLFTSQFLPANFC